MRRNLRVVMIAEWFLAISAVLIVIAVYACLGRSKASDTLLSQWGIAPAFRIKRDVLPVSYNMVWFVPTKPGRYRLFCAEYCGTPHSRMLGWVTVMRPDEYDGWLGGGGSIGSGAESVTAGLSAEQMVAEGRKLYEQLRCNACHGAKDTSRAPSHFGLYGKKVKLQDGSLITVDESYIREFILKPNAKVAAGYQPVMPSYEGLVDEGKVQLLVAYMKSLKNKKEQ